MNLGQAIKVARMRSNLSQEELADAVDCTKSYISLLETNRKEPSLKVLKAISRTVDIKLSLLFLIAEEELTLDVKTKGHIKKKKI